MTNAQVKAAARRIPFDPGNLPGAIKAGLGRIVRRQIAHSARKLGGSLDRVYPVHVKAPGHDAAVKAGKKRPVEDYNMLDATAVPYYEQEQEARRKRNAAKE